MTEPIDELTNKILRLNIKMPVTVRDISSIYQETIPNFDGDSSTLNAYVQACEFLVETFLFEPNNAVQALLLRIFQGKLKGKALQTISSNETCNTFQEFKNLLLSNFGDQRSENCLFNDMINIKPNKSEGPFKFGKRIKETLQLLLTQVKLRDNEINSRLLKTANYKNTALQLYLQGILEIDNLTGIMVQVKQPADLEAAMSYVIEAENFNYRAGRSNDLRRVNKTERKTNNGTNKLFPLPIINNQPKPQYGYQKFQNPYYNSQNMFTQNASASRNMNHSPFYTTQYPQVNNGSAKYNVFAPKDNARQEKSTPMEIDTSFRKRLASSQVRQFKRPTQQIHYQQHIKNYDVDQNDLEEENRVVNNDDEIQNDYDESSEVDDESQEEYNENFHVVCLTLPNR